jgi:hypothetical protein
MMKKPTSLREQRRSEKRGRPRKDKVNAELEAMILRLKSPKNKKQYRNILRPLSLWERFKSWFT